ncbi:MAG: transcription elongation factor GreA [Christensenellales bacterium]|jgi:transcription elongation factor GreA
MANEIFLTREGKEELESKLDYLIKVKRAEMAERVKQAREFGDISENAEYDAAKDEQGMVEDEIKRLEYMLANAEIIDDLNKKSNKISIGSKVKIQDISTGEVYEYKVVGSAEANFAKSRISNESPLGAALLNKKKGDMVTVNAPAGEINYKIVNVCKE